MRCESSKASRGGFTLVEMMVSVALVCLMLALFGEVFSIATKTMSKQKGVAENDQKARMLNVLIRGDLQTMSYRQVPGETGIRALDNSDLTNAQKNSTLSPVCNGYLYISENDPTNQTDDVIQFTADMKYAPADLDGSEPRAFGRALQFGWDNNPFQPSPGDTSARDLLAHNPDQPVFDDQAGRYTTGALTSDQTGSSRFAEVCYFLRNGNLYRRQMLLRQPTDTSKQDDQPKRPDGSDLIPNATIYSAGLIWNPSGSAGTDNALSTGSFWGDFDYSATWSNGIKFNGSGSHSLSNFAGSPRSLGLAQNRFGFGPPTGPLLPGRSIEFTTKDQAFLGRFTHLETSDPGFGWPGSPGVGADGQFYTNDDTNPLTSQNMSLINGVAAINGTNFNGTRVSQDMLMPNVHEFDVKVWDDWALNPITGMQGMFVDIGGAGALKYLSSQSANYGNNNPNTTSGYNRNVYDTWTADNGSRDIAPFRNFDTGLDNAPGKAGIDDDGHNGIDDSGEIGWPGTDDWHDMKMISIHIRYYDIPTDAMRDLTILHSFVE